MTSGVEALPVGGVLLHIGPYKTGTTAIQVSLHQHRADLAAHGVLYPGTKTRQRRASWAAVGRIPRGATPGGMGAWRRMLREIEASNAQRVVVSSEDFTSAAPERVRAIVDDLGRDRVHVLMVIRPLEKLLPSAWQQRVKSSRETLTMDEWLHEVLERPDGPKSRIFWGNEGVDQLVERYGAEVPRDRISIIVSDESDRTQQMRTFEALLGLPVGLLTPGPQDNTSLSLDRTELLRRMNLLTDEREWSDSTARKLIHGGMLVDLRSQPAEPEERPIPAIPTWAVDRVAELNRERADAVRASGCQVIGDPDSLLVPPQPGEQEVPPDHVSVALAAASVAGVVDAVVRREERSEHKRATPPPPPEPEPTLDSIGSRELVRELRGRARARLRRGR
jgi:hypothetical protein